MYILYAYGIFTWLMGINREQQGLGIPSISLIEIVGWLKSSTYYSHENLKYLDALMLCYVPLRGLLIEEKICQQ